MLEQIVVNITPVNLTYVSILYLIYNIIQNFPPKDYRNLFPESLTIVAKKNRRKRDADYSLAPDWNEFGNPPCSEIFNLIARRLSMNIACMYS